MKIQHWKELEQETNDYLENRQSTERFFFHRFYDTASAGHYIPPSPSDFLVVAQGQATFLECKFSKVHESLVSCFSRHVRDEQIGYMLLTTRAGARYCVIFYSSVSKTFEAWDGGYLVTVKEKERARLAKGRVLGTAGTLHELLHDLGSV